MRLLRTSFIEKIDDLKRVNVIFVDCRLEGDGWWLSLLASYSSAGPRLLLTERILISAVHILSEYRVIRLAYTELY